MGGATGGSTGAGGPAGSGGGGATFNAEGPCDIYRDAGQPCVAAYSTVRRLLSTYAGPLYQIRSGSSEQNTGSGGQTHDIGQTVHGFADAAAVDAVCAGTICTVSLLYDQSGKGSHLPVAKAGIPAGGPFAAMDDFESSATREALTVGGHKVYSLYMEPRQGYRLPRVGDGMPRAFEPQGIYMLADGTHAGVGCCFEFGNSPPTFLFSNTTALFYGRGFDTVGAGDGPWFMMEFGEYLSPGTSQASIPAPPNPNNPSLAVKFALGFLKTDSTDALGHWALRMADVTTAAALTTAHQGSMPIRTHNAGGVILGVDAENSNASWGTFYEGAIVAGFPADDTENAVLHNVKAVGYGR
jgi:non-reducing end alpha-L-arabinofuranosidase